MAFIDTIKERARQNLMTIVLPESEDRRTYEAAAKTLAEGNANIIIIGTEEEVGSREYNGGEIIDTKRKFTAEDKAYLPQYDEWKIR